MSATYGEQIVTLITCEYSEENERMVVVAKNYDIIVASNFDNNDIHENRVILI